MTDEADILMSDIASNSPASGSKPNAVTTRMLLMVVLAFLATIMLIQRYSRAKSYSGKADYSWVLRDMDGQSVTLSKYAGKPIFLNLWATWCGYCIQEMPSIEKEVELGRPPESEI